MTKDEFRRIVKRLKLAYRRDNFFSEDEMIDLWYERLGDLNLGILDAAVSTYIDKNTYQPTIADIRTEYQRIEEKINENKRQLREIFDRTRGTYPDVHLNDDEAVRMEATRKAQMAWWDLIKGYSMRERIQKALEIEKQVCEYVREIEADPSRNKIPPLEDFFRGAR